MNKLSALDFSASIQSKAGMIIFGVLFTLVFLSQVANAQAETISSNKVEYQIDEWQTSRKVQENLERLAIPISKSLSYSLSNVLPEVDGRPASLGVSIEPLDPVNPGELVKVVFHCSFGYQVCKPFFEACAALHLQCSD